MSESKRGLPAKTRAAIINSVAHARKAFRDGVTRPLSWRKEQIRNVIKMLDDHTDDLAAAMKKDLGVNDFWIHGAELETVRAEAAHTLNHLDQWVKPESKSTPVLNLPGSSQLYREPYGVALIISPWNYPVSLLLVPLLQAISAGNAVVVKPSEVSVATSRVLSDLIKEYFDPDAVQVVEGAVAETTHLLKEKFDVIMYTGNSFVGKIVMRAAAEHLTPVILELGGKSPAIIADDADLTQTCKRIAWGKWTMNNGQTCVCPDYVLCTEKTRDKFIAEMKKTLVAFYGKDPSKCPDVSRMINERHAQRVVDLLDDPNTEVQVGGDYDIKNRYIAPTVVTVTADAKIMEGEIFGPVLPVLTVKSMQAAYDYINAGEKPLALYMFANNSKDKKDVLANTSSGGACINDVIMHVANPELPFGGVGNSGMGAYHGFYGFDAFSHRRGVFTKYLGDPSLRFPPYSEGKLSLLRTLRRISGFNWGPVKVVAKIAAVAGLVAYAEYKYGVFGKLQSYL